MNANLTLADCEQVAYCFTIAIYYWRVDIYYGLDIHFLKSLCPNQYQFIQNDFILIIISCEAWEKIQNKNKWLVFSHV